VVEDRDQAQNGRSLAADMPARLDVALWVVGGFGPAYRFLAPVGRRDPEEPRDERRRERGKGIGSRGGVGACDKSDQQCGLGPPNDLREYVLTLVRHAQ
jgi:hypothetical protein